MTDWDNIRQNRLSDLRPDEWPTGVRAISMAGAALLGIHEETGKLYWDGKELLTRGRVKLDTFERWIASFAAAGTVGTCIVNIGRAAGWWH